MDRITEFDTSKKWDAPWHEKEAAVMVDVWQVNTEVIDYGGGTNTIGCGWSQVDVIGNTNQIRWGMRVLERDFQT